MVADIKNETAGVGFSRYSLVSVLLALCITAVAAVILSFVYGPCEYYSPLVYLNLFLTYAFGVAIGRVGKMMLRRFRITGRVAAMAVGAIGGMVGWFFAWIVYLWVVTDYSFEVFGELLFDPLALRNVMEFFSENPMWSIGSRRNSAPMDWWAYYGVWAAEAITIVCVAVKECTNFVAKNILCEECGDWVRATGDAAILVCPEDEAWAALQASLLAGDTSALAGLRHRSSADAAAGGEWLEVKGYACKHCAHRDGYINVDRVMLQQSGKKKEKRVQPLLRFAGIDGRLEAYLFSREGGEGEKEGETENTEENVQ